jgi:hypothetical protein
MRLISSLIAISLSAGAALAQPAIPDTIPSTVNLPVVGLASSETAQVNVVNLANSFQFTTGAFSSGAITASCTGAISFYDASGSAIGSATPFTIGSGQIFSATVPYSAIIPADPPPSGNGRTTIRATVTINRTGSGGIPCSPASNIETFDTATGVTHVHVESGRTFLGLAGLLQAR